MTSGAATIGHGGPSRATLSRPRKHTPRRERSRSHADELVVRHGLVTHLCENNGALVLIVAPPGYGKTTLLYQWAAYEPRRFLRIPVTPGDGPGLPRVVDAVGAYLEEEGATGAAEQLRSTTPGPDSLAAAVRLLDGHLGSFVLALDDAQRVDPDVLAEALSVLVEELPAGSELAVASRTRPRFGVGGLRARRDLIEIAVADLALNPAEAMMLLEKVGLELEPRLVRDLVRRALGWPTGLYLAAVSLREQRDPGEAAAEWSGQDRRITEFLDDEVISDLPPELAEFEIQTSILDELSAPVCDAILDRSDSAVLLETLAELNSFLRPVDLAHARFAWHPTFREGLEAELQRSAPAHRLDLHRRASDWFEHHGDLDRAIDHAVAAGDCERVAGLLWPNILGYLGWGRNLEVRDWLGRFNDQDLIACPPLAMANAYSWLVGGHAHVARHWSSVAAAAIERCGGASAGTSMLGGMAALEATLSHDCDEMGRLAAQAYRLHPKDSSWRPLCLLLQGVALHLAGEPTRAHELLRRAVDQATVATPVFAALGLAQSAMIALKEDDVAVAADLSDRAVALIDRSALTGCPLTALVYAASAASRAHQRRSDEAKRDLRTGIDLLAKLGDFLPWYGAETRILLAHASLWLADIVGARSLLAEASRFARRCGDAAAFQSWFDQAWAHMDTLAETSLSGPSSLTIAELRVLRFLPSHRSFREIAAQLEVSSNTVKTQAHAVYRKLGVASRSEAVTQAHAAGLLGD